MGACVGGWGPHGPNAELISPLFLFDYFVVMPDGAVLLCYFYTGAARPPSFNRFAPFIIPILSVLSFFFNCVLR